MQENIQGEPVLIDPSDDDPKKFNIVQFVEAGIKRKNRNPEDEAHWTYIVSEEYLILGENLREYSSNGTEFCFSLPRKGATDLAIILGIIEHSRDMAKRFQQDYFSTRDHYHINFLDDSLLIRFNPKFFKRIMD